MIRNLIVVWILIVLTTSRASAAAIQPAPGYVLVPEATFRAKDGSFSIRQYYHEESWQVWLVPKRGLGYVLPLSDPADNFCMFEAEWSLSPDTHWLARTQRMGSGTYRKAPTLALGNRNLQVENTMPDGDFQS
jgi:hypothetical protein